jgi:hypothetical protein
LEKKLDLRDKMAEYVPTFSFQRIEADTVAALEDDILYDLVERSREGVDGMARGYCSAFDHVGNANDLEAEAIEAYYPRAIGAFRFRDYIAYDYDDEDFAGAGVIGYIKVRMPADDNDAVYQHFIGPDEYDYQALVVFVECACSFTTSQIVPPEADGETISSLLAAKAKAYHARISVGKYLGEQLASELLDEFHYLGIDKVIIWAHSTPQAVASHIRNGMSHSYGTNLFWDTDDDPTGHLVSLNGKGVYTTFNEIPPNDAHERKDMYCIFPEMAAGGGRRKIKRTMRQNRKVKLTRKKNKSRK